MAQAWVFAPPVDAAQAQRLVKAAGKATGCEVGDGPPFGDPTLALTCTKDGVVRASYRGLFGDALAGLRGRAAGRGDVGRRRPGRPVVRRRPARPQVPYLSQATTLRSDYVRRGLRPHDAACHTRLCAPCP